MPERTPVWDTYNVHGWRMGLRRFTNEYGRELSREEADADPIAATIEVMYSKLHDDVDTVWAAVMSADQQNEDMTAAFVLACADQYCQTYPDWDGLLQEWLDDNHGKFELRHTTEEWREAAAGDMRSMHPTWIDSAHLGFGDKSSVYVFNPVPEGTA